MIKKLEVLANAIVTIPVMSPVLSTLDSESPELGRRPKMKIANRTVALLGFAFAFVALSIASIVVFGQVPRKTLPYRFLMPEGYVGWIRVDFNVAGAPPLPIEDGFYIFKFSESGRLQTSSDDIVESRRNEFLYYSPDGTYQLKVFGPIDNRMVHGQFSGPGSGHIAPVPNHYRYIFIGPMDVFERYQAGDKRRAPHEPDGYPRVGPQSWLTREDLIRMSVRQPD